MVKVADTHICREAKRSAVGGEISPRAYPPHQMFSITEDFFKEIARKYKAFLREYNTVTYKKIKILPKFDPTSNMIDKLSHL